jgi:hypothetical protein
MRVLACLAIVFLFLQYAAAQDVETIDHVTDDNVIVLQNGQAYQSYDATSTTWLPGEDVIVLEDDRIVNTDEHEAVDVALTDVSDDDADDDDNND